MSEEVTNEFEFNYEVSNRTAIYYRCYNDILSTNQKNIVKILMYLCAAWIILWSFITILINILHKNKGHQRLIHLFEEISMILLFVFMCILNFVFTENPNICEFISVFIHFFMLLTSSIFFTEALFASSMVHGQSDLNGSLPWICYYLIPIILAAIATCAAYFPEKKYYGTSSLHCFAFSTVDMLWGFIIPVWVIQALSAIKAQLACIACDKQLETQDVMQCYWGRRSVKSLVLISNGLFSIWLMILFASEHQKLYLFIIATILILFFGPGIFVCHTYCHMNTCEKWAGTGFFTGFYRMCPPKPRKKSIPDYESDDEKPKKKKPTESETPQPPPIKKTETPRKINENKEDKNRKPSAHKINPKTEKPLVPSKHSEAQNFYTWLFDMNGGKSSKDVLFQPSIY